MLSITTVSAIRPPSVSETYYCADRPFAAQSKALAQLAVDSIVKELANTGYQAVNRGIHDDLGVLRAGYHYFVLGPSAGSPTGMPGIIGEALFVTNDADAAVLRSDSGRQAIARGYYEAIRTYFRPRPCAPRCPCPPVRPEARLLVAGASDVRPRPLLFTPPNPDTSPYPPRCSHGCDWPCLAPGR